MKSQKQTNNNAKQVKKFMKENHLYFIRNNEKVRKQLGINRKQLAYALQYLKKIGFLEPWNDKVYQITRNSN